MPIRWSRRGVRGYVGRAGLALRRSNLLRLKLCGVSSPSRSNRVHTRWAGRPHNSNRTGAGAVEQIRRKWQVYPRCVIGINVWPGAVTRSKCGEVVESSKATRGVSNQSRRFRGSFGKPCRQAVGRCHRPGRASVDGC